MGTRAQALGIPSCLDSDHEGVLFLPHCTFREYKNSLRVWAWTSHLRTLSKLGRGEEGQKTKDKYWKEKPTESSTALLRQLSVCLSRNMTLG